MIKVKANKDLNHSFKDFEIPESKWNLELRRKINRMVNECQKGKMVEFDAYCDILMSATELTEDDIYNMSEHEIQGAGLTIIQAMNKKK
tara:strand:+ start:270 stop:536 length:267 start_codon:yes stop_codon:yes gene_type:complete